MFFCLEIGAGGKPYPATYDENPLIGRVIPHHGIIKETVKEVPKEYEDLPLYKLRELMIPSPLPIEVIEYGL